MSEWTLRLKNALHREKLSICPERALLWTAYLKQRVNRKKPAVIQIAEATRHVLENKTVHIYPDEIIVGNYNSRRVGGIIYPELAGISALLEISKFHGRKTTPLATTARGLSLVFAGLSQPDMEQRRVSFHGLRPRGVWGFKRR